MVQRTSLERAAYDLAAGKAVVVIEDAAPNSRGRLVFAAEKATPELVAFMVRHTSGYICVTISKAEAERLKLPLSGGGAYRTAAPYTVTVDAKEGIKTGISATDRAHTIQLLSAKTTQPGDLVRPGHVVPTLTHQKGVLWNPGFAEAAQDLAGISGLAPAAAICEIVSKIETAEMARGTELYAFAKEYTLNTITITDIVEARRPHTFQRSRFTKKRLAPTDGKYEPYQYDWLTDLL